MKILSEFTYTPGGNFLSSVSDQDGNITSYTYDVETGLYYLNARYYDPSALRFLNADGIIDENNHSNLYPYCGNNPIVHYDPTGYEKKYTA